MGNDRDIYVARATAATTVRHESLSGRSAHLDAVVIFAMSVAAWDKDGSPLDEWAPQAGSAAARESYGAGDIPTEDAVGSAAYPGALAAFTGAAGLVGDSLPFINLVSAAGREEVLSLYREEVETREGWGCSGLSRGAL